MTSRERIYLSPPHMAGPERDLLLEAFDSNWIAPVGPHLDAFEEEFAAYLGVGHAVAVSTGTAALHLALRLLGVGPGDLVACSTFTFAAPAFAVRYLGAEPVFIDSERSTWNLDPNLLEAFLKDAPVRPKAVIVVDVLGQCADWGPITEVCERYGVPIIEDAAEALGATWQGRPAGTFARVGCFSFNGNKIITTSGGGMLTCEGSSSSGELAGRARYLATQARDRAPHYEHSQIGHNYRLSNLLAAIGRGQLRVLDQRVTERRANFDFYQRALGDLPGIAFQPEDPRGRSTRWLSCAVLDSRRFGATSEEVRLALERENIESRPLWKPMHLQPVFQGCRAVGGQVSERLFETGLCLPSGTNMTDTDRHRIASAIRQCAGH